MTSLRQSLTCWALSPGGVSRIATRFAISSQWAIIASCTALTPSTSTMPLLVGGHQVGHDEHRHVLDGLEAGEAGAVGGVCRCSRSASTLDRAPAATPPVSWIVVARRRGGRAADLLERDQLRLGLDPGHDVVRRRLPMVTLSKTSSGLARRLDDQLEAVVAGSEASATSTVIAVAGRAALERLDRRTGPCRPRAPGSSACGRWLGSPSSVVGADRARRRRRHRR